MTRHNVRCPSCRRFLKDQQTCSRPFCQAVMREIALIRKHKAAQHSK